MHGFQFIFQQGGFGQGGVGGGIPDDSIMTLGSNKLGLSCAKLSNSCQLAWVAYLVVNQLWLELVAWSSSRLESTGWRTVTKCKISLGSATFIQSRLLSHVAHFSVLSNKRFSSEGGS